MEKELTPEQSLELISDTIAQARNSFIRISPFFLIWGTVFVIAGVVEYYLKTTGNSFYWSSWPIGAVIGGLLAFLVGAKQAKDQQGSRTFTDRVMSLIWGSYGFSLLLVLYMTVSSQIDPNPYVMVLTAVPTFVTGAIIKFDIMKFGALAFWAGAIIALQMDIQYSGLIFSAALVLGYLIPGFLLSKEENGIQST